MKSYSNKDKGVSLATEREYAGEKTFFDKIDKALAYNPKDHSNNPINLRHAKNNKTK